MQHEKEGLVLRSRLQELDTQLRRDFRAMSFDGELLALDKETRVPIHTLTAKHDPAVKAGRIGAEMPFADHSRVVAGSLQVLGDIVSRTIEAVEYGHAVEVRVLTSEQSGAARGADGIDDEGIDEARSALSQSIDIRRLVHLRTVGRDGMLRVVVREDEEDVRLR